MLGALAFALSPKATPQVVGPTPSLAVVAAAAIMATGPVGFGYAVVLAGLLQVATGVMGLAKWFHVIPKSVSAGLMTGIGASILVSNLPTTFGLKIADFTSGQSWTPKAAAVGATFIVLNELWSRSASTKLRSIPGLIVGLIGSCAVAHLLQLPISPLSGQVPVGQISRNDLVRVIAFGLTIFVISTSKTLLTSAAVASGKDQEPSFKADAITLGISNITLGLLGWLPVGARLGPYLVVRQLTQYVRASLLVSGLVVGLWFLYDQNLSVALPPTALAALMVVVAWKIIDRKFLASSELLSDKVIFAGTAGAVLLLGVNYGVAIGFLLAIGNLALTFALNKEIKGAELSDNEFGLKCSGALTFLAIPKLQNWETSTNRFSHLRIDLRHTYYIDSAVLEFFNAWRRRRSAKQELGSFVVEGLAQRPQVPRNHSLHLHKELRELDRRAQPRDQHSRRAIDRFIAGHLPQESSLTSDVATSDVAIPDRLAARNDQAS